MKTIVACWESRGGAYIATLYRDSLGYTYISRDCGGVLPGEMTRDNAEAIAEMKRRVLLGYFRPDATKTPMRRIAIRHRGACKVTR